MPSDPDPRTTAYNQQGDVWRHSYAFHHAVLRTAERSKDYHDICDRLYFRAEATEAGDRVTAQLMREAIAHIQALELRIETDRSAKGAANV
jgi:DNA-binding ferritin-like protein